MKTNIRIIIIFTLSAIFAATAEAQVNKKAQVGFRFLENPVSAEVVGRGAVGMTTTYGPDAVFWNPAMLGWDEHSLDVRFNYTKGIADINYGAAAGTVRLGDIGVLAASIMMMDYGTFYGTYATDNAGGYAETGTFSPTAYEAGLAFSQKVNDRFSYGVHLKYCFQDLGKAAVWEGNGVGKRGYSAAALAADVGAFYDFLFHGIRFGATLQNVSREIKYENESFPLPFAVSFGLSVEPLTFVSDDAAMKDFTLSFESRHPRDFGEKVKFGAEYRFYDMFTARVGYMTNYDERGLTAGVGIEQVVSSVPVRVDYAYEPFGIFGAVHFISVGISY